MSGVRISLGAILIKLKKDELAGISGRKFIEAKSETISASNAVKNHLDTLPLQLRLLLHAHSWTWVNEISRSGDIAPYMVLRSGVRTLVVNSRHHELSALSQQRAVTGPEISPSTVCYWSLDSTCLSGGNSRANAASRY